MTSAIYERWLTQYPALRTALDELEEQYGALPWVCGFGLGRKRHDSEVGGGRYSRASPHLGGLCVQVLVAKKLPKEMLREGEHLPDHVTVTDAGHRVRVPVDVVATGLPEPAKGRGWPTAGAVTSGRLFACGYRGATSDGGTFGNGEAELGTIGCVARRRSDRRRFATSAAHVFIDTCSGATRLPGHDHALSFAGPGWQRLRTTSFKPRRFLTGDVFRDLAAFRLPSSFQDASPEADDLLKELAREGDIEQALLSTDDEGFLLVERGGAPARLPIDLRLAARDLRLPITCGRRTRSMRYGFVWKLHQRDASSIGGDSGAPVYLRRTDGAGYRLFAFHFLRDGAISYAFEARSFLALVLGQEGRDFDLI